MVIHRGDVMVVKIDGTLYAALAEFLSDTNTWRVAAPGIGTADVAIVSKPSTDEALDDFTGYQYMSPGLLGGLGL